MKKVTIVIPADVHRALKIEAAETGLTIGEIVVEGISSRVNFLPRSLRKGGGQ